jgi:hypothetical protein
MAKTNFINTILKYKPDLNSLLTNRVVLYLFFFVAIVDVIYLANSKDMQSLITLLLVGFLTSFFSKNMIVILCIALCVTHVLKYGTASRSLEGMENSDDSKDDAGSDDDKADAKKKAIEKVMKNPNIPADLKDSFKEYQAVQGDIVDGIKRIEPLLQKAENFIQKYENYKNMNKEGMKDKKEAMKGAKEAIQSAKEAMKAEK